MSRVCTPSSHTLEFISHRAAVWVHRGSRADSVLWVPEPQSCRTDILALAASCSGHLLPCASTWCEYTSCLLLQLEGGSKNKKASSNSSSTTLWTKVSLKQVSRDHQRMHLASGNRKLPLFKPQLHSNSLEAFAFKRSFFFFAHANKQLKIPASPTLPHLTFPFLKAGIKIQRKVRVGFSHSEIWVTTLCSASGCMWPRGPGTPRACSFGHADSNHRDQMPWVSTHLAS